MRLDGIARLILVLPSLGMVAGAFLGITLAWLIGTLESYEAFMAIGAFIGGLTGIVVPIIVAIRRMLNTRRKSTESP